MLLMAEFNEKNNRQLHANSHGSEFYDPDIHHCENLIAKIQVEAIEQRSVEDEKSIDDFEGENK